MYDHRRIEFGAKFFMIPQENGQASGFPSDSAVSCQPRKELRCTLGIAECATVQTQW